MKCTDPSHAEKHKNQILNLILVSDQNGIPEYKLSDEDEKCWEFNKSFKSEFAEINGVPRDGVVKMGELISGEYQLVETKAPEGYLTPKGQWRLEVSAEEGKFTQRVIGRGPTWESYEGDIILLNYKMINIPLTGGRGIKLFMICGTIMMLSSLLFFVHLILQKKRGKL